MIGPEARLRSFAEGAATVRCVVLLALSDSGVPSYDENLAKRLRNLGIPCFGCTPGLLPELLTGALRGADLEQVVKRLSAQVG